MSARITGTEPVKASPSRKGTSTPASTPTMAAVTADRSTANRSRAVGGAARARGGPADEPGADHRRKRHRRQDQDAHQAPGRLVERDGRGAPEEAEQHLVHPLEGQPGDARDPDVGPVAEEHA